MAKKVGRLKHLGVALETIKGTAESNATATLPHSTFTFDREVESVADDSAMGVYEQNLDHQVEKEMTSGDIEAKIDLNFMDVILEHFFGTVTTSADDPETNVTTRTFTVDQTAAGRTSLTLFGNDIGNEKVAIPMAYLQGLSIQVQKGSFVKFSASYVGNKMETSTWTESYDTPFLDFLFKHVNVKFAANKAGLDAASNLNVREFTLNINWETADDDSIGTDEAVDRIPLSLTYELSMTTTYDGKSDYTDLMTGDTRQAVRVLAENTGKTVGSATNPSMQIELDNVKVTAAPVTRGNNEVQTQSITVMGSYDASADSSAEIITIH